MFDIFYSGIKPNLFAHEQAVDSIEQAQELSKTRYFWWVNYLSDYSTFDFSFEPKPWEANHRHVWASQWQKDNGTYLIPKQGYEHTNYHADIIPRIHKEQYWIVPEGIEVFDWTWHHDVTDPPFVYQFGTQHQRTGGPQYKVPNATDIKYVDQVRIQSTYCAPIYEIDHMDNQAGQIPNTVKTVRYFDNYFDTLKRIAKNSTDEFIWICSSVCDYSNFDFTWYPEQWQATMLHVFPSNGEKFGDTFYMHVPTFLQRANEFELLEWYNLNFTNITVPRRPLPVITHTYDSHVDAIKSLDFNGPLAVFSNGTSATSFPTVPLWREKTKTIVPLSPGASNVIVPKVAIPYIKTQGYDYPYIDKTQKQLTSDGLQDIVFISYDEPDADNNWEILKSKYPQAKRLHGVTGMELALEEAANLSTTPWYFAVFAKTKLHETFDFSFVPDYMQQPKHYIFNCKNTVNGLEYGHMGIVLYNSKGIRQINAANNFGIDYTLSFPHESVPLLSCYGSFDQSPYHTWRTAFRESAKLACFESINPTVEGAYRLNVWLTTSTGLYAEWCLKGATDGVKFFKQSDQQLSTLKQSFRWEWLREYFINQYGHLD